MLKKLSLLLLLAFIYFYGTSVHAQTTAQAPAARLVKRGIAFYEHQDYAGAISSFNDAIKLKPDYAEAYLRRGYVLRAQGALDKAIEDYETARALDPKKVENNRLVSEAYRNRGFIRRNQMEVDSALSDFERALKISPSDLQLQLEHGEAKILIEDFKTAITEFDYVIKQEMLQNEKMRYPFRIALAYCDRGLAKLMLGLEKEGKDDIEAGQKLVPKESGFILEHIKELGLQLEILRRIHPPRPRQIS